jgi:hypothetical protein
MFVYLMIYSMVYLIFNSVRDNDELKLFTETFVIKTLNLCSKLCCVKMTAGYVDIDSDCEATRLEAETLKI